MPDLATRRDALRRQGLWREPRPPELRDLTSNDVLDLSTHRAVRDALQRALREGVPHGAGASRLLRGDHPAWLDWEDTFARWQGAPAARAFATGYAANVGLLGCLPEPGDLVVSDALNHASLIDGIRLSRAHKHIVPHGDVEAAERAIQAHRGTCWVVVESVYSMGGDTPDLLAWAELCARNGAHLIVDEAHATGLYGPQGQGRVVELGLRDAVFASVHTCGKALGLAGAVVVGSQELADWLYNRARSFVFSTAPPPFLAAGLQAALQVVRTSPHLRERPRQRARQLRDRLPDVPTGAGDSHIVPLLVGSPTAAVLLMERLARSGWDARAIRPPTVPEGTSRVRVVPHASLTPTDIATLARDIQGALGDLP